MRSTTASLALALGLAACTDDPAPTPEPAPRAEPIRLVLDPIVTVHPDRLIFEVFSKDEGAYAQLGVDWSAFEVAGTPSYGTTNIDYSKGLFDGVQRMRSYRPTRLTIGPHAAFSSFTALASSAGELTETSRPKAASPSATSAPAIAARSAAEARCTSSADAFGGRNRPYHSIISSALKPCSV